MGLTCYSPWGGKESAELSGSIRIRLVGHTNYKCTNCSFIHIEKVDSHHFLSLTLKKLLFPLLVFDLGYFIFKLLLIVSTAVHPTVVTVIFLKYFLHVTSCSKA